jgi:hypothetical protein
MMPGIDGEGSSLDGDDGRFNEDGSFIGQYSSPVKDNKIQNGGQKFEGTL